MKQVKFNRFRLRKQNIQVKFSWHFQSFRVDNYSFDIIFTRKSKDTWNRVLRSWIPISIIHSGRCNMTFQKSHTQSNWTTNYTREFPQFVISNPKWGSTNSISFTFNLSCTIAFLEEFLDRCFLIFSQLAKLHLMYP